MASKRRQHGSHIQLTLALEDALLQLGLSVDPSLGKWSLPTVDIDHALPRKMGRTSKECTYLLIGHAVLAPYLLPYGLLTGDGKGHVDAVERHPVDEALPLFPLPPGHRIAEGAIVQEEPDGHFHFGRDLARDGRQHRWQLYGVEVEPTDICKAILLEVAVQPHRHGVGIVSLDEHLTASLDQFIRVGWRIGLLKGYGRGFVTHHPVGKRLGCPLIGCLERH